MSRELKLNPGQLKTSEALTHTSSYKFISFYDEMVYKFYDSKALLLFVSLFKHCDTNLAMCQCSLPI